MGADDNGRVSAGLRVAAVQHDIVWEDRDATLARLAPLVGRAAAGGARLIALTEMFPTGFSMRTEHTAEPIDGPSVTWLREQAARHDAWLAGSFALRDPAHELPSNTLVLVGPDGTLHRYDKIHPFTFAGEPDHFRAGGQAVTAEVEGCRIGLSVCYDLRFAGLYWDRAPDVDAELIVANWPAARRDHWRALLDARAIEDQVYVVGVNRVGAGGNGLAYAGDSRIVAPDGEVLASAARDETILSATLDPAVVRDTRERLPFLQDRR